MSVLTSTRPLSRPAARVGVVLTLLVVLFLLSDSVTKIIRLDAVVAACAQLGFAPATVPIIGAVLLVCIVLYLVPRTAVLGAVLLTGYLGGAVAVQLRIDAPLFSTLLFPVYTGIAVWVALYLRSAQLRRIVADLLS